MAVTLGLIFVAAIRKEWPMTFIAVRCPHCQSDQIVKRGKTALSQTTENRKVEAPKSLIFRDPIFGFCLQKATLRQSLS
jgi:hypothetical protein